MNDRNDGRSKSEIDDEKVERAFGAIRKAIGDGQRLDVAQLRGLVERIRVDLMLSQYSRRKRTVYRALIDMFEDDIERKSDDGHDLSDQAVAYIKRLIKGLDE